MISRNLILRRTLTSNAFLKRAKSTSRPPDDTTNIEQKVPTSHLSFEKELKSRIKLHGPMNISQFMLEVLSNPRKGYYTTKENVLGASGDFVTAPEISQMFGECIAIWMVNLLIFLPCIRDLKDYSCLLLFRFTNGAKWVALSL